MVGTYEGHEKSEEEAAPSLEELMRQYADRMAAAAIGYFATRYF